MKKCCYCREDNSRSGRDKVYVVAILDPLNNYEIAGFSGVYDSYDTAASQLNYSFDRNFIDCTGVPDIYVNCEGQLLVIVECAVGRMEDLC